MDKDELYEQAMKDIRVLVNDVKEQCEQFAEEYNYEKEWVFDRFREALNKSIRQTK
ncbi:MAG: hypothetical protein RR645_02965 [Clostridium sp.]